MMAVSDHPALLAAVVALSAVAPMCLVLIVAALRSYTIDLHMTREQRRFRRRRRDDDEDD